MNKKLIALAVAGASIAPAAMAQTANPVTLYGRAYVTLESVEVKNSAVGRRTRVEDQSSLLGVRGTEDLGGGLKAFFQLETAFRLDQQVTVGAQGSAIGLMNRNSGVGLQGGWGSFLMGRWDMPFKVATIAVDPFGDLTIGGITVANNDQSNFDRRDQNVVQYWSPNFGGLTVRLAGTANEGKTATTNPRDYGASLQFTRGPLYLFYAYEEHRDASATVQKEDGNAIGGAFTFGAFKVGGLYEEFKRNAVASPGFHKRKSYLANVVWTMGSNQFIYQFQNSEGGNRQNATNTAISAECDVNSLGYQYNFTRRTFFLAQYVKVDNNDTGSCGSGQFGVTAGADAQGISFGLRHVF
jgi:predicted porin